MDLYFFRILEKHTDLTDILEGAALRDVVSNPLNLPLYSHTYEMFAMIKQFLRAPKLL